MKASKLLLLIFITLTGCVQPAYKKTVVVLLTVKGLKDIQTVGVRGEGSPLSWNEDLLLTPIIKDSLYTITKTTLTAFSFTEIKFTVNGKFEMEGKPNRRLEFAPGDTTYFRATFNE